MMELSKTRNHPIYASIALLPELIILKPTIKILQPSFKVKWNT